MGSNAPPQPQLSSDDQMSTSDATNYYMKSQLYVNYSTPSPTSDYVVWQDPDTEQKLVEVICILAALAASAMIIVGVAFFMSKLRKRNLETDGSETGGSASSDVQIDMTAVPTTQVQTTESSVPHYAIKHVYSISGLIWDVPPPEKRSLKRILMPNFMKRKPTPSELPVAHEKLKKDLSMIYVY